MSTRFILGNALTGGATVLNGTGVGAPARVETSPYVMERALQGDRYSAWKFTMPGGGSINFDFSKTSLAFVTGAAMLGGRALNGGGFSGWEVYAMTAGSYYPGVPTWSLVGSTNTDTIRDQACVLASMNYARWRFTMYGDAGKVYTVGKFLLGTALDLGARWSPGGGISPFQNRIEQELQDGSLVVNTLGDPGADIEIPFHSSNATMLGKLKTAAATTGSVVLLDDSEATHEAVVVGGRVAVADRFIGNYDAGLRLRKLP